MVILKNTLAGMIDSTNIRATASRDDIERLCKEAIEHGFGCVCVNLIYTRMAASLLKRSKVKVCSTVGFPFGATLSEIKALEAIRAIENGAEELDMVMNFGAFKSRDYDAVRRDVGAVVDVKRVSKEIIVKVIIETAHLSDEEKVIACKLVQEAGGDFVKTSTGLFGKGATVEDVRLMRQTVDKDFGVKAAGGIRTYDDAIAMIEAGANRIGTSTAVEIIKDAL